MMKNIRLMLCAALLFAPLTTHAEVEKHAEKDPAVKAQEDSLKKTHSVLERLIKGLKNEEQGHLFMAYNNYNLISTVKVVQKDVGNAVKECGENNPEIKGKMEERFDTWNGAINPVLEEAQGNLDNMIIAQDYVEKGEVEELFASVDETRKRNDARIDKIPVTTMEACEFLLGKMDETQASMLSLLRSTLVTYPQAFPPTPPETQEEETSDL